jgi:hypothetical protein
MKPSEITRREMLQLAAGAAAAITLQSLAALASPLSPSLFSKHPTVQDRKFHSAAVETYLSSVSSE